MRRLHHFSLLFTTLVRTRTWALFALRVCMHVCVRVYRGVWLLDVDYCVC